MQAAVVVALAGVERRAGITTTWTWAHHQASTGMAMLLAMSASCKFAATHTALACSGYAPESVALPGLPPLSVSWGWLVLGVALGALLGASAVLLVGWWKGKQIDQARLDILNYITVNGQINAPRLRQLAQAGGVTEVEMLRRVTGLS